MMADKPKQTDWQKRFVRGFMGKPKEKTYEEMTKEEKEEYLRKKNREKDPTANAFASGGLAGKAYRNIIEDCKKKKNKK